MARKLNDIEKFWKELKRRNVVQVIAAYAAVSFIILQLVDIIAQPLNLPVWTLKSLIILLCIGFIIVVLVSWIYDITSGGIKKTKSLKSIKSDKGSPLSEPSNAWKIVSYVSIAIIFILIAFNIFSSEKPDNLSKFEKSIAVLPFINDSPVDSNKYFINGIIEDILNDLQAIKNLKPISRTSTEKYRNTTKSIPEIAKELGVNYVVEGSGQRSGNKTQLNIHLYRAPKETPLWAKSYEQEMHDATDIFRLQSQIAEAITSELRATITSQEKQFIEKIPTRDIDAYDAYLKGQFYWAKLTQNDLETAMKYFELAKEIDPGYALAYAGISDTWIALAQMGYVAPIEAGAKAKSALIKSTQLDTALAQVHYSLALLKYASEWDWKSSELEFQKVFAINPNHAGAHAYYSHLLNIIGRPKEALEQIDIALKLDPINPLVKAMYGIDLLFVRRYNEAILISGDALKTDPTNPVALLASTYAFHETERYKEALRAGEMVYKIIYPEAIHVFCQGNGITKESYLKVWKNESDTLARQSQNLFINPTDIAYGYVLAGEKDKALKWLEKAYEVRDQSLMYELLPCYDNLRNEPRFKELCRKMNLPYK